MMRLRIWLLRFIKIFIKFDYMLSVSKSYRYFKNLVVFGLVLMSVQNYAQTDSLFKAQDLCSQKRFEEAIRVIDPVVYHADTKDNPHAWHIRAFAHLQYYKSKGSGNTRYLNHLDTALKSSVISDRLDQTQEFKQNNSNFIKNGSIIYYKLCSTFLQDSLNYDKAQIYFDRYKKSTAIIEPNFDFKAKDIEYYTAAGSTFSEKYMENFDPKYGEVAKAALLKVLELDPKNIKANLNLGVIYYNQGATLMRQMDYDIDLNQLDVIQENAKKLFKQSLPFMTQVYELNPRDKRVLEGLQGIYYSLNEFDKSNEFKQKLEQAQNQK